VREVIEKQMGEVEYNIAYPLHNRESGERNFKPGRTTCHAEDAVTGPTVSCRYLKYFTNSDDEQYLHIRGERGRRQ